MNILKKIIFSGKQKYIIIFNFIFFISIISYSLTDATADTTDNSLKKNSIFSKYILDISIEGGIGIYIGDFGDHLKRDGAYILTPTLDIYLSFFIIKYFGIQTLIGSGCIIHRYSQPIEGTLLYMGLELFGQYDWKYINIKIFAGTGFQHATMLIQWYSSAFFECGTGIGIKITDWIYINTSFKYRFAYLESIIIKDIYDLPANDTLMSVTISTGLVFRIKNSFIK